MTLDELIEEIEKSLEDAEEQKKIAKEKRYGYIYDHQNGKAIAFRICLEKLREYRLSSGAE